jgi:hypothetical protein
MEIVFALSGKALITTYLTLHSILTYRHDAFLDKGSLSSLWQSAVDGHPMPAKLPVAPANRATRHSRHLHTQRRLKLSPEYQAIDNSMILH